jgi:hypothetical protein
MQNRHRLNLVLPASLLAAAAAAVTACTEAPAPKPPAPAMPVAEAAPAPAAPAAAPAGETGAPSAGSTADPANWKVSTSADDPQWLEVAGLRGPKPSSWVWTKPSMQFRTLQYSVPGGADSTLTAELIVSVFVAGDGGPLEANIERWRGQFRNGDEAVTAKRARKTVGPLEVELVELEGDYFAMGAPAAKRGFLQLAAIVQAEGRNVFLRLVGPKDTVESNRAAFDALIDGLMPGD